MSQVSIELSILEKTFTFYFNKNTYNFIGFDGYRTATNKNNEKSGKY